ncbi:group II intron maturase-specific domain-containing protein [Sellimonas intestinalis]|uniref:group II intron maturase-specific domain-containing protein n=1 Tax=Sellimonas intestinalis TaxID=1653434 RepID=UPI002FE6D424
MKNKIRELTDRNKGISNAEREKKYQEYVRGWVEYFRLADMKGLLKTTDKWARRRIRAVYWKQWKKTKTKYRMLKALGMEHWKAKELACSRKENQNEKRTKVLPDLSYPLVKRRSYRSFRSLRPAC